MHSILIIEDDSPLCGNMALILQMEGFDVRTAGDGASGIAQVRERRPDLILCDIMMPDMDGHSFLKALREERTYAHIPFIFVTALGDRDHIRRGMAAGADDYLTKPFSAEELTAAVTSRLRRLEAIRMGSKPAFQTEHAIIRQQVSPRELEVLLLVGQGASSKEIAERLAISLRTVEVHRSNLMRKLGATNAAALARWALIAEQL